MLISWNIYRPRLFIVEMEVLKDFEYMSEILDLMRYTGRVFLMSRLVRATSAVQLLRPSNWDLCEKASSAYWMPDRCRHVGRINGTPGQWCMPGTYWERS
jgi:hypothetical protein